MSEQEIRVPDLGDFKDVEVIDVLVKPGDRIALETPLVTLETEKATMDVPSSAAGVVRSVSIRKGDRVSKGSLILSVDSEAAGESPKPAAAPTPASPPPDRPMPPPAPSRLRPRQNRPETNRTRGFLPLSTLQERLRLVRRRFCFACAAGSQSPLGP